MRLLKPNTNGKFSLTEDFVPNNTPEYAILSHTWGKEEVTYRDMIDDTGESKAGYEKIRFCAKQAANDRLQYFWVDTCCIDKSSSAELQEAINSMFRWYQNATKCYVYLSDVSMERRNASDQLSEDTWESAFRSSRWFTRGWTLQELLAPTLVEFFSREHERLGDKRTLEQQIHEITGIDVSALQGDRLSQFGVEDRFLWAEKRQTTREEDMAYSLLGMFNVYMPLIYGEGRENALKRLREEIDKPSREQKLVLNRLPSADNAAFDSYDEEHNARCYQGTRVELLRQINTWASDLGSEYIFWLNGMAGTGKSTISRTVAQNFADKRDLGASFFFKRGEGDRGHAGLFITTIASQLVQKVPSLAPHVQKAIEDDPAISKKALKLQFETLVLQPLSRIQTNPQKSSKIMIVIDALDECDQEEDIRTIIRLLPQVQRITSVQLKFFLTSRPELPIRLGFEDISGKYEGLALHQIPESIVKEDISAFLEHELAIIRHDYNKSVKSNRQLPANWPGQTNIQILVEMAMPLFIFATTVCRFIRDRRCGQPNEQLAKVLKYRTKSQVSKLDATYLPVLNQLLVGVTNSDKRVIFEEFQQIVGSIVILASPLSATSLDRLLGVLEGTVDSRTDLLHSVLSIPSHSNHPIRLLHLSFRDFLIDTEKREINPFWVEEKQAHQRIANRCIWLMSSSLKQDICDREAPGVLVIDVASSRVDQYLPAEVRYACLYWIQHLQKGGAQLYDNDQVHQFLRLHLLHWLEALGWIGRTSEGILAILSLEAQISADKSPTLYAVVHDAKRFVLHNRSVIEQAPLQLYCSALVFAPEKSIVRRQFEEYIPTWIQPKPKVQENWNATLQTLAGHSSYVSSVAFSPDGKQVVSGSYDKTVRLWDATTGAALQTLAGHSSYVSSVAFSPDGKQVVSGSYDKTVRLWDATTGAALQTLAGHSSYVSSVAFSPDGKQVVSGSGDKTVRLWDATTGAALQTLATLAGHSDWVSSVAFSPDGKQVVSGSYDKTVRLWDATTGAALQTLAGHSSYVSSVAFSPDGKQVVSGSGDKTVRLWDATTGAALQTLAGHSDWVSSVAFSPDGKQVVSGSGDKTVRLWDATTGAALQTLAGHSETVSSVAFSPDGKQVVSGSYDKTVRLWDATTGAALQTLAGHSDYVSSVAFSPDGKQVVSGSYDKTVRLWDATTGAALQTLAGHSSYVSSVAFSPDGKQVVSGSYDKTVRLWDATTGAALQTLAGHSDWVSSVAFSPDGKQVVSGSYDKTVRLWDATTGAALQTLAGHSSYVSSVAFSPDGKQVVSGSDDKTVRLWDATTGAALQTLAGHSSYVSSVAFSPDGRQLPTLLVSNDWVVDGGTKILWLPPNDRLTTCVAIWNKKIVLGYSSGRISIIGFQEGSKVL